MNAGEDNNEEVSVILVVMQKFFCIKDYLDLIYFLYLKDCICCRRSKQYYQRGKYFKITSILFNNNHNKKNLYK
jgi:hypothetical protein